jgi:hypothetical protein
VTLSMVPKNWIWSFDQIKQMIFRCLRWINYQMEIIMWKVYIFKTNKK